MPPLDVIRQISGNADTNLFQWIPLKVGLKSISSMFYKWANREQKLGNNWMIQLLERLFLPLSLSLSLRKLTCKLIESTWHRNYYIIYHLRRIRKDLRLFVGPSWSSWIQNIINWLSAKIEYSGRIHTWQKKILIIAKYRIGNAALRAKQSMTKVICKLGAGWKYGGIRGLIST